MSFTPALPKYLQEDRTYFYGTSSDVLLVSRSSDGTVSLSIIDGDVNADIYLASFAASALVEFLLSGRGCHTSVCLASGFPRRSHD